MAEAKTMSQTQHHCKNCGRFHDLRYATFNDGSRHMFYVCPINRTTYYVPRVDGLNLPTEPTNAQKKAEKKAEKREAKARQQPTFEFAGSLPSTGPTKARSQRSPASNARSMPVAERSRGD